MIHDEWLLIAVGTIVLVFIAHLLLRKITNPYLYALVVFPGVVLHELMHFILAIFTLAKPVRFSLIPKKTEDGGWTLGSVSCMNVTWYNAFPVAMAPLLLLLTPITTYILIGNQSLAYWEIAAVVVANLIITHSAIPSLQDFKVAASRPIGSFLWMSVPAYFLIQHYAEIVAV